MNNKAIIVQRCDGDRQLQSSLRRMAKKGYTAQHVNSRKAALGFLTGPFTHKQVHTVTYVRGPDIESEVDKTVNTALDLGLCTPQEAAEFRAQVLAA